jgi:flavin-dependent dehydrogenase
VLSPDTLAAAPELDGRAPDLVVDASGRARVAARALGIGADVGPRNDVAHFAHFEGCAWREDPGQVVIMRLAWGWSWCIPLGARVSVGVVMGREDARRLGASAPERLERAIASDERLAAIAGHARRVTPVATYSNYQLISQRGWGPGWVAVGDAFGFVDPMLSPGVHLSLRSAELVADAVIGLARARRHPAPEDVASALSSYAAMQRDPLAAWMDLVSYLYDGRMLALLRAGRDWMGDAPGALKRQAQRHIERHIALQASGMATTSRYSRGLLRMLGRHGLRGVDPAAFSIR